MDAGVMGHLEDLPWVKGHTPSGELAKGGRILDTWRAEQVEFVETGSML